MDSVQERWMHNIKQFILMFFTVLSVYRLCVTTLRLENNREICFANLISRHKDSIIGLGQFSQYVFVCALVFIFQRDYAFNIDEPYFVLTLLFIYASMGFEV